MMPGRNLPLVNEKIYHILNRGIDHRTTFTDKREFQRGIETLRYYQFAHPPKRLSNFLITQKEERKRIITQLINENEKLVDILCFVLMPNHFHFLLRQKMEGGISRFLSNFQNSFTRYFNTRHKRIGPLFLDQFKAVRIETDEQLLHVSRYIHLNPVSSYLIEIKELEEYPWSSLPEYLGHPQKTICEKKTILSFFKTKALLKKFIFDQADYQRKLETIKHLVLED